MKPNGTWEEPSDGSYMIYVGGEPLMKNKPYEFVTEDGFIREIHYENVYTNVIFAWEAFGGSLTATGRNTAVSKHRGAMVNHSRRRGIYLRKFLRDNQNQTFDVSITWTIRIDDQ